MLDGFSSGMVGLGTNCFPLINYANIQSASHKGGPAFWESMNTFRSFGDYTSGDYTSMH